MFDRRKLGTLTLLLHAIITALLFVWMCSQWKRPGSAYLAELSNAMLALFTAAIGCMLAIAALVGLNRWSRKWRLNVGVFAMTVSLWCGVVLFAFRDELRHWISPHIYRSYAYTFINESDQYIACEVVASTSDGSIAFKDSAELAPHSNGGWVGLTSQPPERIPVRVEVSCWRGGRKRRAVSNSEITKSTIPWPSLSERHDVVALTYTDNAEWVAKVSQPNAAR